MSERHPYCYRFDDFVVEPRIARLSRCGEPVAVEPKAFEILAFLLAHPDRLVDRQELLDAVWRGVFVTDNALTRAVARLRHVLGDHAREPHFIETVPCRGYRFLIPVEVGEGAAQSAAEARRVPAERPRPSHEPARLRITVQLIDAAREEYLWSKEFDPEADVSVIQTEASLRVAEALRSARNSS